MDTERWHEVDELFQGALDCFPEERSRFLASACAGDRSLREEVEALLAADREGGGILDGGILDTTASLEPVARAELGGIDTCGEQYIGPYRLEREIGHGGMGTVILATRADDAYRRRVAVKLLNPGMASAGLERRFRSERQILAALEHPLIARLYDGGTTPGGRPYLVMEYVDGIPIDEYCDRHRLSVRRRLELFRQVCSAVHYAHQNLVVHRDLKPSNILVTAAGEPRLLDFGIAKLLDPEAFSVTVEATVTGLRPMTPGYASPEQARGGTITTASDVYSLGVLLYRLLTGRAPHRFTGLSAREVERLLAEEVPPKPSLAVSRAGRRQLKGDLDNIVLTALAKEPARRYGSVQQLSEDLRRHLVGLPVLARKPTLRYQMRSFLRRYKLAVAVAGLVAALVVAFAVAMTYQATQVARERDRAEQEKERAEQEKERAERVSGFLVDLFEEVDPGKTGGETVTARQVLDWGAERLERELVDQPEMRASLLTVIGRAYGKLGHYEQAVALSKAALDIRETHPGRSSLDVAESLSQVADLYTYQGRYDAAEPLLWRALEIWENTGRAGDAAAADAFRLLSNLHRAQGRYAEAERHGLRAVALDKQARGPEHPQVAASLRTLAGVYRQLGNRSAGQRLLEEALAIDEQAHGEFHPATASDIYNLAQIRFVDGEFAAAEPFLERALAIFQTVFREDHPRVADTLVSLAFVAKFRGDLTAAERRLRPALAAYERALSGEHALVANCLFELGDVLLRQDRLAEAEPLLERSLAVRRRVLGASHPGVGESLSGLARLHARRGDLEEAERLFQLAMEYWERDPRTAFTHAIPKAFTAFLRAAGRLSEAAALEAAGV